MTKIPYIISFNYILFIFSCKLLCEHENSTGLYLEHMMYICFYSAIQNIIIRKVNYMKHYK